MIRTNRMPKARNPPRCAFTRSGSPGCGRNPIHRKRKPPAATIATRLARKRSMDPIAIVRLIKARPSPTFASGGASDAAIATPANAAETSLRLMA